MALNNPHIDILSSLKKDGYFADSGISLIEFGEQNWYSKADLGKIMDAAKIAGYGKEKIEEVTRQCIHYAKEANSGDKARKFDAVFAMAKLYYSIIFNYSNYSAIDLHGTSIAQQLDLNQPLPIKGQHDVIINFGTSEHVFNQYMFFKNMHDVAKSGALLLNLLPNQGDYDHGFYSYHPTFFFDLAEANKYEIIRMYIILGKEDEYSLEQIVTREDYVKLAVERKLTPQSGIFVMFRKRQDDEFVTPQQGYYNNKLNEHLREAWQKLLR